MIFSVCRSEMLSSPIFISFFCYKNAITDFRLKTLKEKVL